MLARSAVRPRRQNSGRADEARGCPPFLQWLRGRVCALSGKPGHQCQGKIQACHVDYAGDKGMGIKVSDQFAIPMCAAAHEEQHRIGWHAFEDRWVFRGVMLANELYRHWLTQTPMGVRWVKLHVPK